METVMEAVQENQVAPDFVATSTQGQLSLSDLRRNSSVLLYFMREFGCAMCRQHVVQLGRLYSELLSKNVEVVVIGGGDLATAQRLANTYKLPFAVVADSEREIYHKYGLHKAVGFLQRSGSILVDRTGVVRYVQRATLPTGGFNKTELLNAVVGL